MNPMPPGTMVLDSAREQLDRALFVNLDEDGDVLQEFVHESQEHLQNIEQGVLVLEKNPCDAETLDSIFRAFHTFKGGAGFLNLESIQTLAHELESVLDLARQQKLAVTPEVINLILAGADTLTQFMTEIGDRLAGKQPAGAILVPTGHLLERIRKVLAAGTRSQVIIPVFSIEAGAAIKTKTTAAGPAIKVDTLKLDTLVDLVGELVIAQSLIMQNQDLNTAHGERLTRDLAHFGRISKDLQRTAMSLRMVPIRATFLKMHRLVRDLTAKVGKQVELVTDGDDIELDRIVVEQISDPLIHMVRNSIDHGIESPEARRQQGKPARGLLFLKAFHQGGNIVIEITDDGSGLDREKILAKAREKGLAQPEEKLSDSQIYHLILTPGFSTTETVTDLSGRGVGLDVVRRNIDGLRGKIKIQSVPGEGSTFRIFVPLTLAIIDGLLVGVGEHRYILPALSVCESFQPRAGMIQTVQGRGEVINVRGRLLPLLRLGSHLGLQPATTDAARAIVVVVEAGKDARCVLVDQVLGKQEFVIKNLGETFQASRCLAGAAILGNGRVGLILDPHALVHLEPADLEAAA